MLTDFLFDMSLSLHTSLCIPTGWVVHHVHSLVAAGCECGILFSTYDLLISSTRPSKAEAAAIKVAELNSLFPNLTAA